MDSLDLSAGDMQVRIGQDHFELILGGLPFFDFSVRSSVEIDGGGPDLDGDVLAMSRREANGRPIFEWTTRSSLWERKRYVVEVYPNAVVYRVLVTGKGRLGRVAYFTGGGPPEAWGSRYEVARYLVPAPGGGGSSLPEYHSSAQDGTVGLHYLAPPLLAFPFAVDSPESRWLAVGLAPRPGGYNLDHFSYHFHVVRTGGTRCYFSTDHLGYTAVDGEHEAAAIVLTAGGDEFAALDAHAAWLYDHGGCARRDWRGSPRWWRGPLFCGWGEQCNLRPDRPLAAATQRDYEWMCARLDALRLQPSAVIIDDKWMSTYGEALPDPAKWPDLRGFVEAQHAKGRRVMLWFKAWNTEGLPVEECVNLWSQPCGADPNAPAYRERMRRLMQTLLGDGEGGFNCDGFKVDFANVMPLGRNLRGTASAYGLELLKQWFTLFYESAKAAKPDCLVNASCAHPYFAEVVDQCRLHDYYWGQRAAWTVMSYRHRLSRAALPGVLIDTDGVASTHRETMDYIRRCPELGVPDLYFLTGTPDFDFTEDDFQVIRDVWAAYAGSLGG